MPKVKEVVDGQLTDKCFKKMRLAAKLLTSGNFLKASSQSLTDDGLSDFEMSKSHAHNSLQFSKFEIKK